MAPLSASGARPSKISSWRPPHGLASPARLQVNGKMRGAVEVDVSIDQEGAVAAARGLGAVAKQLEGKEVGPGGLGAPCCACCACLGMLGMRLRPDSYIRLLGTRSLHRDRSAGEEGDLRVGKDLEHHCGQVMAAATCRSVSGLHWMGPESLALSPSCSFEVSLPFQRPAPSYLICIGIASSGLASVIDNPARAFCSCHSPRLQVAP